MAKRQNIIVTGRAANQRIEDAIPRFMSRFGMPKDQATAVAIRLESVGRLSGGGLIETSTVPKGDTAKALKALTAAPPPSISASAAQAIAAAKAAQAMRRSRQEASQLEEMEPSFGSATPSAPPSRPVPPRRRRR
jgi:hypothetical protein